MRPGIDDLVVTLVVGDEAHVVVVSNLTDLLVTFLNESGLLLRDDDVIEVERQTGEVSHAVTQVLDTIEELAGLGETDILDHISDDVAKALLRDDLIDKTNLLGDDAVDDDTSNGSLDHVAHFLAFHQVINHDLHLSVQVALALVVSDDGLLGTIERESLALCTRANLGDIVQTEHHVL